jgi:hypothetical protein
MNVETFDKPLEPRYNTAYELYCAAGQNIETPESFDAALRTLHTQYLRREITLVKMADALRISTPQLSAILEAAGLPLRSVRPRICNL